MTLRCPPDAKGSPRCSVWGQVSAPLQLFEGPLQLADALHEALKGSGDRVRQVRYLNGSARLLLQRAEVCPHLIIRQRFEVGLQ